MAIMNPDSMRLSAIAENIIGSEILKLSGEIDERRRQGDKIHNFTVGDFDPKLFPIPTELMEGIIRAYRDGETNYPPADGILRLRQAVSTFLQRTRGLSYPANEIIIASGARPLIYAIYRAVVDDGEGVLFPIPSWNNNHYTYLLKGRPIAVEATAANNFMPVASDLEPHMRHVSLVALCSPLNPSGTVFTAADLDEICTLIVHENAARQRAGRKPVYVLYDQVYWPLTLEGTTHVDPVSLQPAMRQYTLFVDGISKSLAATGVRVGWTMGPKKVIDKMKAIIGHMGAWAPRAEQVALADFLNDHRAYDAYVNGNKSKLAKSLGLFHAGFQQLKHEGFPVDSIAPQAGIYLTVQIALRGRRTSGGEVLTSTREATRFLLEEAGVAMVPFYAFGASEESNWYRLSVGTARSEDIPQVITALRTALGSLA